MANFLKWQDIQILDVASWNSIKQLWQSGNYSSALAVLQQSALVNKWQDAGLVNDLTSELVRLQNQQDTHFRDGIPITSKTVPTLQSNNQLWFEVI